MNLQEYRSLIKPTKTKKVYKQTRNDKNQLNSFSKSLQWFENGCNQDEKFMTEKQFERKKKELNKKGITPIEI